MLCQGWGQKYVALMVMNIVVLLIFMDLNISVLLKTGIHQ